MGTLYLQPIQILNREALDVKKSAWLFRLTLTKLLGLEPKNRAADLGDCVGCIDAEAYKKDKAVPVLLVWMPALQ